MYRSMLRYTFLILPLILQLLIATKKNIEHRVDKYFDIYHIFMYFCSCNSIFVFIINIFAKYIPIIRVKIIILYMRKN